MNSLGPDSADTTTARLADIARMTDVSIATVSKVLNNRPGVGEQTRRRVAAAIQALNYRSTTHRQHADICVVFDDITSAYSSGLLHHLILEASVTNQQLVIRTTPPSARGRITAEWISTEVIGRHKAIIAVTCFFDDSALKACQDHGIRVMEIDPSHRNSPRAPRIAPRDEAGTRAATIHLQELGHEDIAFLEFAPLPAFDRRREGYLGALRDLGLPPRVIGRPQNVGGYEPILRSLLTSKTRPTAIVCPLDQLALGVSSGAMALGIRVPEDLSITGFDDIPTARMSYPPLTTVRQDLRSTARAALTALQSAEASPTSDVLIDTMLVIRESTSRRRSAPPGSPL